MNQIATAPRTEPEQLAIPYEPQRDSAFRQMIVSRSKFANHLVLDFHACEKITHHVLSNLLILRDAIPESCVIRLSRCNPYVHRKLVMLNFNRFFEISV